MKLYRGCILGPDLSNCDIVSYNFGDAEIQFRLPHDPKVRNSVLEHADVVENWRSSSADIQLVKTKWYLKEDINGLLASTGFVRLEMNFFCFDTIGFEKSWQSGPYSFTKESDLRQMTVDFCVNLIKLLDDDPDISKEDAVLDWDVITDPLALPVVKQDILPWCMNRRRQKTDYHSWESIVVIPVSDRSVIIAQFDSKILTSDGETFAIPKSEHEQFDQELREEFFSHVNVKYSDEILQKIKAQNG